MDLDSVFSNRHAFRKGATPKHCAVPETSKSEVSGDSFGSQKEEMSHFTNTVLADFRQLCAETAERCLALTCSSDQASLEPSFTSDDLSDAVQPYVDRVSMELDNVFKDYAFKVAKRVKDERWWASFLLHDLEKFIQVTNRQYSNLLSGGSEYSLNVRFGRVYAWARATLPSESVNGQSNDNTKRLQSKLRRHLSRLVWLSRIGKRRLQSHPLLTSLRHELLRIRARSAQKLLPTKSAPIDQHMDWISDRPHLPNSNESLGTQLQRIIPSTLVPAFVKLVDKLTDLFLALPSQIPGVIINGICACPDTERKFFQEAVVNTILGFYTHMDVSTEDVSSSSNLMATMGPDDLGESDDSNEDASAQNLEPNTLKSSYQLNPSVVQAALDRFDHSSRQTRRRALPTRSTTTFEHEATEEAHLATSSSFLPDHETTQPSVVDNSEQELLEVLRLPQPTEFPAHAADQTEEHTGTSDSLTEPASTTVIEPTTTNATEERASPSNSDIEEAPVPTGVSKTSPRPRTSKRKAARSLRTRRSGTPSENSFSEGEVLSDSEEEHIHSTGEAEEHAAAELSERMNVDIEEEEAEELIRLVNDQLRERTPASDIDFTELEIMDEWAPGAGSMATVTRPDAERSMKDELLAEVEALFSRPKQVTNDSTVQIHSAALDSLDRELNKVVTEALALYGSNMDQLIGSAVAAPECPPADAASSAVSHSVRPTDDVESRIERTASAFKEHVTSVLTNILHAIPGMLEADSMGKYGRRFGKAAPVITGRRGSRFIGMLKAYQQDVTKKMTVTAS